MYTEVKRGVRRLTGGGGKDPWPIGSIYFGATATDPATLFGGTWVRFGKGQVLVGVDEAQTEFDTALETGGAKTHTLTTQEMPGHWHNANTPDGTLVTSADGSHDHVIQVTNNAGTSNVAVQRGAASPADTAGPIANDGQHSHSTTGHTATTGGGSPHNNLQPYISVYIWRRTA